MEIVVILVVLMGIGYASTLMGKKPRKARPLHAARNSPPRVVPSKYCNYDSSAFRNDKGGFSFPKYSVKSGWVRISDATDYKAIWNNMGRDEKAEYGMAELEEEIKSGGLELEVSSFWEALKGAKKADLGELAPVCGSIELLGTIWDAYEEESGASDSKVEPISIEAPKQLCQLLVAGGAGAHADFADTKTLQKWLNSKPMTHLQEICKSNKLKVSGNKAELVTRVTDSVPAAALTKGVSYVVLGTGFRRLIETLAETYVSKLSAQMQGWHPLYVSAVWAAAREVNEHEGFLPVLGLISKKQARPN